MRDAGIDLKARLASLQRARDKMKEMDASLGVCVCVSVCVYVCFLIYTLGVTCTSPMYTCFRLHQQVITVAAISEKLKVNGSLARKSIDELVRRGLIKCVARHSAQRIYTKVCTR